ncbi:MAG: hypothetical protein U1G05_17775 [Kiritimatiellia bacterium]
MTAILGISAFSPFRRRPAGGREDRGGRYGSASRARSTIGFPIRAIEYCLAEAGIAPDRLEAVVFYEADHEIRAAARRTSARRRGDSAPFQMAMPIWLTASCGFRWRWRRP